MSTVDEIQAALPQLTTPELMQIEQALHAIYRQRRDGIFYDDAHGVLTETDLIAASDEAFLAYDKGEDDANRPPRWNLASGLGAWWRRSARGDTQRAIPG